MFRKRYILPAVAHTTVMIIHCHMIWHHIGWRVDDEPKSGKSVILWKKDVAEEVYFAGCGTYDCYDNTLPYDMALYRVGGR